MDLLAGALLWALNDPPDTVRRRLEERHISEEEKGFFHSKQKGHEEIEAEPERVEGVAAMLREGHFFGRLMIASITQEYDVSPTQSAMAAGGEIGYETAAWNGLALFGALTTSQKLEAATPDDPARVNPDYFDAQMHGFTYLSRAGLLYEAGNLRIEAGRIGVEVPYADSDDIRMAPNTFEGVSASYGGDGTAWELLWLRRMAGFDSEGSQERFDDLFVDDAGNASAGLFGAGMTFSPREGDEASLWLYHVDRMASILYGEYAGHRFFSESFHVEFGLQGSYIAEASDSGIGGATAGGMAILHGTLLFGGIAANYAAVDGDGTITDGFGGGPYYTSLDEMTIGAVSELAPGSDIGSVRLGIGADLEYFGVPGVVFEAVYGYYDAKETELSGVETDLILTWEPSDALMLEWIWMDIEDSGLGGGERYERSQLRLAYSF